MCGGGDDSGGGGSSSSSSSSSSSTNYNSSSSKPKSSTTTTSKPASTSSGSNSFTQSLANFFTPNDGQEYVGGQLVSTGSPSSSSASSSNNNVSVGYGSGQVDPSLARAAGYNPSGAKLSDSAAAKQNAGASRDVSEFTNRDQYIANQLSAAGYSNNYMGVSDGRGNAVLDGFGNPVKSGTYVNYESNAGAEYDAYQDYKVARAAAEAKFNADMANRRMVDQDMIDVAMGKGGYLGGDFYNADGTINKNYDPTNADVMMGPPTLANLDAYGRALGGYADTFAFPEFSFEDPYGTAMAPRVSQIDGSALGSKITTDNETRYFDSFAAGYNKDSGFLGTNIERDAAGNTGFSTAGQRFGDAVGGMLVGTMASAVNPVLGGAASGLKFNTMDQYGEMVPDYGREISTVSYNPGRGVGGMLGSVLAPKAAMGTAQAVYGNTGSVNKAIAAGAGAGALTAGASMGAGNALGSAMGFNEFAISSDIQATPYQNQVDDLLEERGFGARLTSDGGDNGATQGTGTLSSIAAGDENAVNLSTGTGVDSTLLQTVDASGDIGSGQVAGDTSAQFDSETFITETAEGANPNTVQLVDLSGNPVNSLELNPLFSAAPPGVQYLSKGRQRDYGGAIYQPQNRLANYAGSRRRGIGDRLVGMIV